MSMNPNIPPELIERVIGGVKLRPKTLDTDFAIDIRHAASERSLNQQVFVWSHRMQWTEFAVQGGVPYDIAEAHIGSAPHSAAQNLAYRLIRDWQKLRKNGHIERPEQFENFN